MYKRMQLVEILKLDKNLFFERDEKLTTELADFDVKLDKQRDDQLTLEQYCERYIPIQAQGMIIDNMNVVMTPEQIERLKSEENKLHARI